MRPTRLVVAGNTMFTVTVSLRAGEMGPPITPMAVHQRPICLGSLSCRGVGCLVHWVKSPQNDQLSHADIRVLQSFTCHTGFFRTRIVLSLPTHCRSKPRLLLQQVRLSCIQRRKAAHINKKTKPAKRTRYRIEETSIAMLQIQQTHSRVYLPV